MKEKIGTLLKSKIIYFIFKTVPIFYLFNLLYKVFLAGAGLMGRSRIRSRLGLLHNTDPKRYFKSGEKNFFPEKLAISIKKF